MLKTTRAGHVVSLILCGAALALFTASAGADQPPGRGDSTRGGGGRQYNGTDSLGGGVLVSIGGGAIEYQVDGNVPCSPGGGSEHMFRPAIHAFMASTRAAVGSPPPAPTQSSATHALPSYARDCQPVSG